eukprot:m.68498 g.68498  ORF g.68498 m.68498 type:complete len:344 (-) comp7502_c0_seq1:153-1184(-)
MSHLTSSIAQALKSVEGSMGGAQSTWTTADIGVRVAGRTVIVTGASSGLGLEVARVLALHGATIIMAVRSVAKAQPLKEAIDAELAHSGSKGSVAIAHVDMEDLSSIRAFAAEFAAAHTRLDLLVNNAGMTNKGAPRRTAHGHELHMGTNHYGAFLLTTLLLPVLMNTPGSRVVAVASIVHTQVPAIAELKSLIESEALTPSYEAYCRSKLANLLFTHALAAHVSAAGRAAPMAVAAHPGFTTTPIITDGWTGLKHYLYAIMTSLIFQDISIGVLPILMACVDPDATQGAYYGPCGPFELWGGPVRVKPGAIALDSNLIEWLWEHSKTKTSCDPDAVITLARD